MYGDINYFYEWEISQKSPLDGFGRVKETFIFNEIVIKTIMKMVI